MVTQKTVENMLLDAGVVYVNYGLTTERVLGATNGGNKFLVEREFREVEIDGLKGKTKGMKRLLSENASLEVNLKEMSSENIMLALPGSTKTDYATLRADTGVMVKGAVAQGATTAVFDGTNLAGSLEKGDKFTVTGIVDSFTLTEDAKVISGEITVKFTPAVPATGFADDSPVVIEQTYESIRSTGKIGSSDYLSNIALVATRSDNKKPCVIILENALNDNNLEMATKDKDEVTVVLKISAHYDPANLKVPYEIRYPKVIV